MRAERIPLPYTIFFHPDYTVGLGVSPNPALRLAGCTAGGESHPALKILIQLSKLYAPMGGLSTPDVRFSLQVLRTGARSGVKISAFLPGSAA